MATVDVYNQSNLIAIPHQIQDLNDEHKTEILEAASGHEQRINKYFTSKSHWKFFWRYDEDSMNTLRTFFNSQGGRFESWTISDPRIGNEILVRYNADKLSIKPNKWKTFDISVEVIEVF